MNQHIGSCRILLMSFQQLMPENLLSSADHLSSDDECFRNIINQFSEQAVFGNNLTALEYAKICKQVAEFFEPNPADSKTKVNQFNHQLRNILQIKFTDIRKNKFVFKSHDEHIGFQNAMKAEKNLIAREALKIENVVRTKSHLKATGIVKLIAELFNVGIINLRVLELCIKHILFEPKNPTELDIECFHILYVTAGLKMETNSRGIKIVQEALVRLEEIIDEHRINYCERIRLLCLDVFVQRANFWESKESQIPQKEEQINEAEATSTFLKEIKSIISQLTPENMFDYRYELTQKQFNKERLEGMVVIIFERALAEVPSTVALFCKAFAHISTIGAETKTFKDVLMDLCFREIKSQRDNYLMFKDIAANIEALKHENQETAFVEKKLKMHNRACQFGLFYGELFNLGLVCIPNLIDFLVILSATNNLTNTSIEIFWLVFKASGTKILSEASKSVLLKESILKLRDAAKWSKVSARSKFLIKDLLLASKVKLNIDVEEDMASYRKSTVFDTRQSIKQLWEPIESVDNFQKTVCPPGFRKVQNRSSSQPQRVPNGLFENGGSIFSLMLQQGTKKNETNGSDANQNFTSYKNLMF